MSSMVTTSSLWPMRRLKSLLRLRRTTLRDVGGELPQLSLSAYTGVSEKRFEDENQARSQEALQSYQLVKPGDLVTNPMWLLNGGLAVSKMLGVVSPAYRVYEPSNEVNQDYLHHVLRSEPYLQQYNRLIRGLTTYDRSVTRDDFEALRIPLPPLAIQQEIATRLGRETARIDALVAKKEVALSLLEEKRQAIIGETFGTVGRSCRVKNMCQSIRDGTHAPPPAVPGIHRLLSVRNMIDGHVVLLDDDRTMTPEAFAELERSYSIREGDTLVAVVGGTTGKIALVGSLENSTVQRSTAILRPRQDVNPRFLFYWMQSPAVQGKILEIAAKYAAQPGIYLEDVASLPGVQADIDKQNEVVTRIDDAILRVESLAAQVRKSIGLLRERRQALITTAVSGNAKLSSTMASEVIVT